MPPNFTTEWYADYMAKQEQKRQALNILAGVEEPEEKHAAFCGPEGELHDRIIDYIRSRGWLVFHGAMNARTRRTPGEPDAICLLPEGRVLFVELKTKSGKLSVEQQGVILHAKKLGTTIFVVRSLEEFQNLCENASQTTAIPSPQAPSSGAGPS